MTQISYILNINEYELVFNIRRKPHLISHRPIESRRKLMNENVFFSFYSSVVSSVVFMLLFFIQSARSA